MSWGSGIWLRVREFWARLTEVQTLSSSARFWPPPEHRERLNWYRCAYLLFKGRHEQVYDPFRKGDQRPYVAVNLLGSVSRLCARRLFGEPAAYEATAEEGQDAGQQDLLDFLVKKARFDRLNLRQAQTASYCGDTVYKVRYDAEDDRVVIEGVNPAFFFPTFADGDQLAITEAAICWVVWSADRKQQWLRKELHAPGSVRNELWSLKKRIGANDEDFVLGDQVPFSQVETLANLPEQVATGVDELLVVHIPNAQVAEDGIWGLSDYEPVFGLQGELNNRATRLAETLDLHAAPRMYGNDAYLNEAGDFAEQENRFLIVRAGEDPPGYLVWDASLAVVKQELDDLRLDILRGVGVSPESFGLGQAGGAESGRAIKLRQTETTSTVQAKGALFDDGLRQVLSLAMKLYAVQVQDKSEGGDAAPLEADDIEVKRSDGLPEDPMDDATLFETLMQPTALKPEVAASMAFGWSEEEALEKIKEPPPPAPPPQAGIPFTPLAQRAAALQERRAALAAPAEVAAGGTTSE